MSSHHRMLAECKDRLAEVHRRKEHLLGLFLERDIPGIYVPEIMKDLRDLSEMEGELEEEIKDLEDTSEMEDAILPAVKISKSKKRRQRKRKLLQ